MAGPSSNQAERRLFGSRPEHGRTRQLAASTWKQRERQKLRCSRPRPGNPKVILHVDPLCLPLLSKQLITSGEDGLNSQTWTARMTHAAPEPSLASIQQKWPQPPSHRITSHPRSRHEGAPRRKEIGERRRELETSSLSVSELLSTTGSAIRAIALHNLVHPSPNDTGDHVVTVIQPN